MYYQRRVSEMKERGEIKDDDAQQDVVRTSLRESNKQPRGELLDEMGIHRICCRRHFLAHTDLIDVI